MAVPRTVFISGASSGIGRALALEYARKGAHVAIAARRTSELETLAREMERAGGKARVFPLDVADTAAVKETVVRADHELGSLDMVIANAGVGQTRHATRLTYEDMVQTLDVNVRGTLATLVAAIPVMLLQKRGHLVGVTSLAGRRGLPAVGAYSASKAAVSTFLETLRLDLTAAGIKVTDIQPGFVDTAMTSQNKHPMPFLWPVDKAARIIVQRLERAPATLAFPWPMAFATGLGRILPPRVYDLAVRATGVKAG